jgi:hypothetical protein
MSFGELILAASLLSGTAPPEFEDPAALRANFPTLRFALIAVAVEWEILDRRETDVFARAENIVSDLEMVQKRYRDLLDAPPLCDSARFPNRAAIDELLAFNRAYRCSVENRQPMEAVHGGELRTIQEEVDHLYAVWDTLRDAQSGYRYVTPRRLALQRLRELLGAEAYYRGEMPPHVPLWRFQEIK